MKGCCQLQAKVCARLLVNCLFKLAQEISVVRLTDPPAMTIAVDLGRKATTQTNKNWSVYIIYVCVIWYSNICHSFIFKLCIMIVHTLKMCIYDVDPEQSLVLF